MKQFYLKSILSVLTIFLASYVFAEDLPHTFTNGTPADANQINANFDALNAKINASNSIVAPIGSIIPWHKSLNLSITLPEQWVECNGQTISDTDSPFNGQAIPDLNGEGRFLRGGTTSGEYQEDQMQSHKHNDSGHQHQNSLPTGGAGSANPGAAYNWAAQTYYWSSDISYANLGDPTDSGTGAGEPRHGDETRPKNMSVVWIIRIK